MPRGRLSFSSLANFDPSKESNALIVLSITREEVMSCQIGVAADALMKLSDSEDGMKTRVSFMKFLKFARISAHWRGSGIIGSILCPKKAKR